MSTKTARVTPRSPALPIAIAAVAALALTAFAIAQGTGAFFADTTSADENAWESGQVVITDDGFAGEGAFDVQGIAPGYEEERTITVTDESDGLDPDGLDLRVYATDVSGNQGLRDALEVTIDASFPDADSEPLYDGSLDGLPGEYGDAAPWEFAAGDGTATEYTVTVAFPSTGEDQSDLQERTAEATLVWEARTTGEDHDAADEGDPENGEPGNGEPETTIAAVDVNADSSSLGFGDAAEITLALQDEDGQPVEKDGVEVEWAMDSVQEHIDGVGEFAFDDMETQTDANGHASVTLQAPESMDAWPNDAEGNVVETFADIEVTGTAQFPGDTWEDSTVIEPGF